MAEGFEVGADLATGALLGRAVEPRADDHAAHGHAGQRCLNCGTELIGSHCHTCGQSANVHRTMGAIGHELAHGVFHFDGKMWRTLPLLVTRPGELTRRYVAGERARYVSPLALFLFTVFLMFTVVANLPGWNIADSDFLKPGVAEKLMETRTALANERARLDTSIAQTQAKLAKVEAAPSPDAERITDLKAKIAELTDDRNKTAATEKVLPSDVKVTIGGEDSPEAKNWFERKWQHVQENPKLLLYKVKTSAYKFSWALIPISLPFIWLLFPFRRDVGMYDHAIFVTYSLTFMSLLTVALAVLGAIGVKSGLLLLAATIAVPWHMYRQVKDAYGLTRLGGLWRTFWLLNFALIASIFFVTLLLYLGVAD